MSIFFIGIIFFFISGFVSNLLGAALSRPKFKIPALCVLSFAGSVLCLIPALKVLAGNCTQEQALVQTFTFNPLFGDVSFVIDPLSAFFILIISIIGFLPLIYSNGYLAPYIKNGKSITSHLFFLPVLIGSMLLVVTCENALMFLICWEIMSLSSFFLVIFENESKEVRRAGIRYLIFMHISVIFIILAFALAAINAGSYSFSEFKEVLSKDGTLSNIVFILAAVGFSIKAGFVPFHNWLPSAHPKAPSHVSAMMSGVMIKTGIYGILRIISITGTPTKTAGIIVLTVSIISALYGVLYAIAQHDIKRLLAYHSIENIGIIGIGIGTGMLGLSFNSPAVILMGFGGAILHTLNHSIFKELLFLTAGSVYLKTHTKNIELLGGLIKKMPYTGFLFLIGSLAICGLPPFNGFISEFLIYYGMFTGLAFKNFFIATLMIFMIAGLAFVGTMAILCFAKAFSVTFLGSPRSKKAENVEGDNCPSMLIPVSFLAVLTLIIGVFPQYIYPYIEKITYTIIPHGNYVQIPISLANTQIIKLLQIISLYTLGFIIFLIILISLKLLLTKNRVKTHVTWGCGYNKPNNNMQYTASSFASPFLSMLRPLFKKIFDIEKPKKLFPKSAHFSLHIEDIEEAYVLNPLIKYDEKFLSKFETLQSGNIQSYIKYGLLFLATVVIVSLIIK